MLLGTKYSRDMLREHVRAQRTRSIVLKEYRKRTGVPGNALQNNNVDAMRSILNGPVSFHTATILSSRNLMTVSRDGLEMASVMPLEAVGTLFSVDKKPYLYLLTEQLYEQRMFVPGALALPSLERANWLTTFINTCCRHKASKCREETCNIMWYNAYTSLLLKCLLQTTNLPCGSTP